MKHTLHFFLTFIYLLTGVQSFAAKKSNTDFVCPTASISYAGNPFCTSTGSLQAVTLTGTDAYLGGIFSSAPGGLTINSVTGEINLNTSAPGTYIVTYTIPSGPGCPGMNATTTVIVNTAPTATISYASTPFCTSNTTPQAVTFTGTSGAYTGGTFSSTTGLSINATTGAITPSMSTAGTYTVTYTIEAANGCPSQTNTTSVTVTTAPTATITYASPFCENITTPQAIIFSGTSGAYTGGTFSSTTGLTIDTITGAITPSTSTTGTYIVTYTIPATSGCASISVTSNVVISPIPTNITISGSTAICVGNSATLTITGTPNTVVTLTDGSNLNSYTISASGVMTISVSPTVTTTYTLTSANLNECTIPVVGQSATVIVNQTPQFITQIPDIIICNGEILNIASQLTSTIPGTTFVWSANTTNTIGVATSGDETNIDQLVNLIDMNANGSISIQVRPKIGSCYGAIQQIEVTVKPIPIITSTVANHNVICNNQFVTITTNSYPYAIVYNWQVNAASTNGVQIVGGAINGTSATGSIDVQLVLTNSLVPGTISFNITPVNGICYGSEVINAVTITVNPIPGSPIGLPTMEICSGEPANLSIEAFPNTAGTMLEWTVTDSQNVTGFSSGIGMAPSLINDVLINTSNIQGFVKYSVTTKLGDCEGGTTEYFVNVNPLPNPTELTNGEITIDNNGNVIPYVLNTGLNTADYSFNWFLNNVLIVTAESGSYTATELGDYSVLITNLFTNCMSFTSVNVTENLVNNDESKDLVMYPNPSFDSINFSYNSKVKSIEISNQLSQIVLTKDVNMKNGTIDLSELNNGIYNIVFETEAGIVSQRIIKQ